MNITISNAFLSATIDTKGAELNSLKKEGREYMWEGNPDFWGKHSPILFPIVGTLKNDSFIYDEKSFSLSRHGFARYNEFEVYSSNDDCVVFSLKSNPETLQKYPFQFELRVAYILNNSSLKIEYSVLNKNDSVLPFSIGGHPAFALTKNFESYSLTFDNDEIIKSYFLENDLLSDNFQDIELKNHELKLHYPLFKNDALIIKNLKSKSVNVLENRVPLFKFEFEDFPNLGIWTKENAPFVCIEPWHGYSDILKSNQDILEKEGIIKLEKYQTFSASFSIHIY